ncbi:MAG: CRISPR-associated protein Cas4 [Chloroflexi bacterium]|nr:MAG: CRISPR-associated protein Cas4 [Chloroflexota bacterium]
MLPLAVGLLVLALMLLAFVTLRRRDSGLPGGRIIYADTREWGSLEKPLYDSELGLTGKPDYLVEKDGKVIPVEVKTKRIGEAPHDSHIYQLAAYCLLVHRVLGKRPPYGILHYSNKKFAIDYTQELENYVITLLLEIRSCSDRKAPERSHESAGRCAKCGYRTTCDQAL